MVSDDGESSIEDDDDDMEGTWKPKPDTELQKRKAMLKELKAIFNEHLEDLNKNLRA